MSRDAGGTYTAPSNSFNPAVEGTALDEGDWNTTLDDIEAAFTESVFTSSMGATDNQLVRTDGTSTKKVQGTTITVDDSMNMSGLLSVTTAATVAATASLTAKNTTDNASVSVAIFEGDRATMANNDEAYISLRLSDSAGNQDAFGRIKWRATDVTSTSEDGVLYLGVVIAGTMTDQLTISNTGIAATVPVTLPTYTVATLPAGSAGQIAYASNGRKNGEGAGVGTGVVVFKDGSNWRACDTGATVAA